MTYADVYACVAMIPEGNVTTYGLIASALGSPCAARFVGYALQKAPDSLPCHRVVSRTGALSAAFSPFGKKTHRELLLREQVPFLDNDHVDLTHCLFAGFKGV